MATTVPASRTTGNEDPLMHPAPYPTRPQPAAPALHLLHGLWVASCPLCGYQLTSARTQARCERRAARRTCPVCREDP
jgi:hypothetical protein